MTDWISHRGYCAEASENTEAAFDAAIELGFDHLETDLRCTRDGHIVLCHDANLGRISADKWKISDYTRREIEQVRLFNGEPLLFFDQFLDKYQHLRWILDIKPDSAEQTLAQLAKWQQQPQVEDFLRHKARYLLWGASHEQRLKSQMNDAFCLARDKACYRAGVAALVGIPQLGNIQNNQCYAVPPQLKGLPLLKPKLVQRYHQQGARVIGYLPETVQEHEQAIAAGVDEILTNQAQLRGKFGS